MKTYKTSDIAVIFGLHTNTIRLYEELGFITKPERMENGYRIFTELQIEQIKLTRIALKGELIQNGLRKTAIDIIKVSASGNYQLSIEMINRYLKQLKREKDYAEDAIKIAENILNISSKTDKPLFLTRKQAADLLQVTIDTLRNWELNGLLSIKRKINGYRVYNEDDIKRLEIIRCLRCANYSLTSIIRMLNHISHSINTDIKSCINTPKDSEDIVSVCDRLLTSLCNTEKDANEMLKQIIFMKAKFTNPPL